MRRSARWKTAGVDRHDGLWAISVEVNFHAGQTAALFRNAHLSSTEEQPTRIPSYSPSSSREIKK